MPFTKIIHNHQQNLNWFTNAVAEIKNGGRKNFFRNFARVPRYFRGEIALTDDDLHNLQKNTETTINFALWSLDEIVRGQMLVHCFRLCSEYREWIKDCYHCGDNSEQIALIKSLALMPDPLDFLDIASDAFRTNIVSIFAALACHNPFPAKYFDQKSFNNLVVKTIFVDLSLNCIQDLNKRNNPELAQILEDWIDEREAANRPVPVEVWSIILPFAKGPRREKALTYLKEKEKNEII